MAELSSSLFSLGVLLVAFGFAAHVGHAVMLANGRRTLALAPAQRPAYAGAVSGSFVTSQTNAAVSGPQLSASPSPLSRAAIWLTSLRGAVARPVAPHEGDRRPARAVGQHVRVHGRVLVQHHRRLPVPAAPVRDPLHRVHPLGRGARHAALRLSLPSEIKPLVPALQNAPLLTIHVGMAVVSYGIFATSFAAGVAYLIQGQEDRFAWLPSHKTLDEVAYRAVIIGFPIFATMIILGSWWASIAWSRYWGWDPKETAALATWLIYAVYLHARNQRSWAGRPAALLLVVGFGMVLVTYSGSLWFSGLHAYSGL